MAPALGRVPLLPFLSPVSDPPLSHTNPGLDPGHQADDKPPAEAKQQKQSSSSDKGKKSSSGNGSSASVFLAFSLCPHEGDALSSGAVTELPELCAPKLWWPHQDRGGAAGEEAWAHSEEAGRQREGCEVG